MTAPAYCILRAEKLSEIGNVAGSAKHTFREIPTPNADPRRTHLNKTWGAQNAAAVCQAVKARLPAKRRKDSVLCIEYLVTASPEWFKTAPIADQNGYFDKAVKWIEARHGKANVVCVNMQLDEKSPHLVAYVVPLTREGRLSAKDFLGGRKALRDMQTHFAQVVGKPAGLQRGIEGSKAPHTTAKQYAAALQKNPTLKAPEPPAPTIGERLSGKARKMQEEHEKALEDHFTLVEQARNVAKVSQRARGEQAAALVRLRKDVDKAEARAAVADQLRVENRQLRDRLLVQQAYFRRQMANLKAMLAKAVEEAAQFMQKIDLLKRQRDDARAEAEQLRQGWLDEAEKANPSLNLEKIHTWRA